MFDPGEHLLRSGIRVAALLVASGLIAWVGPAAAARAGQDLVGELKAYEAREGETLLEVARRNGLGFVELLAANPGVDPWVPGAGVALKLPTAHLLPDAPRDGIVINLAELRLYYFSAPMGPVATFPLGTGKAGRETPLGETRVVAKRANPTWVPPPSIRTERPHLPAVVPPGPDNPLGAFALDLGWDQYVIHGTNKPFGIGRRVSHGCVRLYPEDIARLFEEVSIGARVTVVDQPVKIGWSGTDLYLEVHPTQSQADEIETGQRLTPEPVPDLEALVGRAAGSEAHRVDWDAVRRVARERRGIPVQITRDLAPAGGGA
jgi:L,D-transpeptidase ErfK/SrfK